jgi:iron-sulfur cluster assembly accessory protein
MIASLRFLAGALLASAVAMVIGCGEVPSQGGAEPQRPASPSSAPRVDPSVNQATPLLAFTPAAAARVREVIREGQAGGMLPSERLYLRVRLVAGGCCGFLHKLDLGPDLAPEDHAFEVKGVRVVIWKRQIEMLRGTRIDYVSQGEKQGFSVKNPNFEGAALKKWLPLLEAQEKAGQGPGTS